MKTLFVRAFVVALLGLAMPLFAAAQSVPSIDVPDYCTITDDAGGSHDYSEHYLGICALAAAKEQGAVSSYQFHNYSFGLFLTTLNGIAPDPNSQFWDLSQNGTEAQVGLSDITVTQGDVITFQLTDFTNNSLIGPPVSFKIGSLVAAPSAPAAPQGGGLTLHDPFNVPLALGYIWSTQGPDGSFGSSLLDDWVAIASAGGGAGDLRTHLSAHEMSAPPTLSSTTDYERHAMALEALGINPYSGTPVDYITPIVKAFDGTQVGDPSLVNDDIFAIFPLLHAGYGAQDDIIVKIAAFVDSKQHDDGSWEGSADLTAAAVQALTLVHDTSGALSKALGYLRMQEAQDGSFGNSSATSWVLQAIMSVGEDSHDWSRAIYHIPDYYLATKQEPDGGVEPESADTQTRVWATAYAIPAIEHKTWDALLSSFPKPVTALTMVAATTTSALDATTTATATDTVPASTDTHAIPLSTGAPAVLQAQTDEPAGAAPADSASSTPQAEEQTAAAVYAGNTIFEGFWSAIVSFFLRLF
jgi:hypothetical protein